MTARRVIKHWRRWLVGVAAGLVVGVFFVLLVTKDHIRTLASLKRVPGANAYVLDYYASYDLEEIRDGGMDVQNVEDSYIQAFFPDILVPIARGLRETFVPGSVQVIDEGEHHCSTLFLKSADGAYSFGRNQDYNHDALLILRIHTAIGVSSIAAVDLAYLNLNRDDLDQTNWIERIPLLFAPYYAMDGMNRHGVAVGIMSVDEAQPPRSPEKPAITHSTLMRVLLDNARSAAEAVDIVEGYNVHFVNMPQHLLVCDASGDSRIVEYLDGQVRATPADRGWQVSTNSEMWGRTDEEIDAVCSRYRTGSALAEELAGTADAEQAWSVIRSMSVDGWTMWTSLYNLTTGDCSFAYKSPVQATHRDRLALSR